ncbi:MAG: RNA 3'-terminal phosphate cyclase [Candidatus Woesearchaeota archaeon]
MLYLDGSQGEGGGQILRTALALSTLTKTSFEMQHIRKGRKDAGIKNQHLFCIKALEKLCNAKTTNAKLGSSNVMYMPGEVKGGIITIDIETAGSITLLLQSTILPALFAEKRTKFRLTGGTDVQWSMSIDYFRHVVMPHLVKYADLELKLEKRGYYPEGGGHIELTIKPKYHLKEYESFLSMMDDFRKNKSKIDLLEQGKIVNISGISHASMNLQNANVAERQAKAARTILSKFNCPVNIDTIYCDTHGIGSGITVWARFSKGNEEKDYANPVILGADAFGEKGLPSEDVGRIAAEKLAKEIDSGACVDQHLADNLIPFLAFGGEMKVVNMTEHTKTNIWTTEQFLGKIFKVDGNIIRV